MHSKLVASLNPHRAKPTRRPPQGVSQITPPTIDLYDEYTHITLDRRALLRRKTALVGSTAGDLAWSRTVALFKEALA